MYKTILSIFLAFILFSGYLVAKTILEEKEVLSAYDSKPLINEINESVFGSMDNSIYFTPEKIKIYDEIGSQSLNVEKVKLDSQGQLEVPEWDVAGWYISSARPGERGNVIINGHYDREDGSPAAFWGLKNVKVDDRVTLQDELRRNFTYEVVDIFYVDIQDPHRTEVFENTGEAELTLITCGGVWNPVEGTYDKRLVVRAKLI